MSDIDSTIGLPLFHLPEVERVLNNVLKRVVKERYFGSEASRLPISVEELQHHLRSAVENYLSYRDEYFDFDKVHNK